MKNHLLKRRVYFLAMLLAFFGINLPQAKADYVPISKERVSLQEKLITLDKEFEIEGLIKYISEFTGYSFFYNKETFF
jgi:hypothetical protein